MAFDPGPQFQGVIKGYRGNVRTKFTSRISPMRGATITEEWASAGKEVDSLLSESLSEGMEVELVPSNKTSRLVRTTTKGLEGYGDQTTTIWQVFTNEIQREILEHPNAIALGLGNLNQIQLDAADIKAGGLEAYGQIVSDQYYTDNPDGLKLLELLLLGVTSFNFSQYVARRTVNVPFLYEGSVPAPAPDSVVASLLNSIPVDGPNDGEKFKWGWKRMSTSRTFTASNRTEISDEWWLASWSVFIYGAVNILPTPG